MIPFAMNPAKGVGLGAVKARQPLGQGLAQAIADQRPRVVYRLQVQDPHRDGPGCIPVAMGQGSVPSPSHRNDGSICHGGCLCQGIAEDPGVALA